MAAVNLQMLRFQKDESSWEIGWINSELIPTATVQERTAAVLLPELFFPQQFIPGQGPTIFQ